MNAKQITAIVVVVGLLAVGIIGAGYAFQAQYTDETSGTGSATGQFLRVVDSANTGTGAYDLDAYASSTLYLNCPIKITKTGASTYDRFWYPTVTSTNDNVSLTTDDLATTPFTGAYAITENKGGNPEAQTSITVRAVYCIGAVDVYAPQKTTTATVAVDSDSLGAASMSAAATGTTATAGVYYELSSSQTWAQTDSNWNTKIDTSEDVISLTNQTILKDTATTYYLYAVAIWDLTIPTVDSPTSGTYSLAASTPIFTATATDYVASS